jgi:hypothetical protein
LTIAWCSCILLVMSEPLETATEPVPAPPRPSDKRAYVGDPLPNAMGADELMRVLNLKPATFYNYQKAGKLKRFEFRRPVSHTKRYSGALVKRYLEQTS